MSWLRWSYRIGFLIAGIAAVVFAVRVLTLPPPTVSVLAGERSPEEERLEAEARRSEAQRQSLTILISGVTCLVSTMGAFSTMFLAWRLDRRQSRETSLRIAQLQIDLERSRQVKVDQS